MNGNIYNKYSLSSYIDNKRKQIDELINRKEITESSDIDKITDSLIVKATIELLILGDPIPSQPIETTSTRSNVWGDEYDVKIYKVPVSVPFSGDIKLLDCQPNPSTIVYLENSISITRCSIDFSVYQEKLNPDAFKQSVEKVIEKIKTNLPKINKEIEKWNQGLEPYISSALEKRISIVSDKHNFMKKIGLSVNPSSDKYLIPNIITKKKIPSPTPTKHNIQNGRFTPILINDVYNDVYNDIKKVLYNVGQAIERKPSIYKGKYEEDLRDIFLLFLETRYDSTTGVGEAFNKKGKTDILLKYAKDGTNIFVAECKFWKGKKSLLLAIDQLLGYLTHRDSKTALMVFVDQQSLQSIINTAKTEVINHKNFKRFILESNSTSFSYEFTLPDCIDKTIQIEIMFFHFPK